MKVSPSPPPPPHPLSLSHAHAFPWNRLGFRAVMSSSTAAHSGPVLGRALCIVTGASRGFGRVVARDVFRLLLPGSALVIVARSGQELRTLQAELSGSEAAVVVECVVADLGDPEGPRCVVQAAKAAFSEEMGRIILVNNAGRWFSSLPSTGSTRSSGQSALAFCPLVYSTHYGKGRFISLKVFLSGLLQAYCFVVHVQNSSKYY